MALRNLILAKKLQEQRDKLETLIEEEKGLEKRSEDLIEAIEESSTEEELDLVERESEEIDSEKKRLLEKKEELQSKIDEIEKELSEIEDDEDDEEEDVIEDKGERKVMSKLITRGAFKGLTHTDAELMVRRDDSQKFIKELRSAIAEKRALNGGEYLIPDVFLGLIREQVYGLSKLAPKVWRRVLRGDGRYNIAGAIPEAVWTEACATLNELTLSFNQAEVDGYKVGGYVAICNAILEDSDLDLANEVLSQIAQSIAIALDKAIVYGTGVKMPTGIITALEGVSGTPNLVGIDETKTGAEFYADLISAFGKSKGHGATNGRFYAMNEATFTDLQVRALSFNSAGAIVSGQNQTMPVLGGDIEITDVIADGTIVGGYGDNYLLAERAEVKLARSEHVQFIEDNTVFKGTARYDGKPVFDDAFVAVKIGDGTAVPASNDVTFAPDTANTGA